MLVKENAIRSFTKPEGRIVPRLRTFHAYLCAGGCGREVSVSNSHLKVSTGKCKNCGPGNRLRPFESLYNIFCGIQKRRGMNVGITYEDFLEFTCVSQCHYCEELIVWRKSSKDKTTAYNLDRKDNALGYVKDNLVVCCGPCNWLKGDLPYKEFFLISKIRRAVREFVQ